MKSLLLFLPIALWIGIEQFPPFENKDNETPESIVVHQADKAPFALLELFTSQGCSSCPSADDQLARFAERATDGESIYALSYHVDYWNYLGWKDPFSDARFSDRQRAYAGHLRSRVYTPQLVVNGQAEMIGSRRSETEAAVKKALAEQAAFKLDFNWTKDGDQLVINYSISGDGSLPENAQLVAVAAQHEATRQVKKGENRGRELKHVNVVRAYASQPFNNKQGTISLTVPKDIPDFDIIIFAQESGPGRVLAAAKS